MRFLLFHLSLILTFSFIPSFMNFHVFFCLIVQGHSSRGEEEESLVDEKKAKWLFVF